MCSDQDNRLLAQTLELAHQGAGRVEPNPRVGAVIVQAGEVVATGFHSKYGGLHAEAVALQAAGDRARGSTLYCSLEPCSYRAPGKRQPPCTDAIIAAGVSRVVIGQQDPNPAVRGSGVQVLRRAGITVDIATDSSPFFRENEVFNTVMALGRPFVHLKAALSLDGRIATGGGDSKWITDEDARASAHRLRADRDAVLVGRGTVEADDPLLTVRSSPLPDRGDPRAVVMDAAARIPRTSRLVRERPLDLIVCTDTAPRETAVRDRVAALRDLGVTVLECGTAPEQVLAALYAEGIRSLLVEGGARIITSFLKARFHDRVTLFVAPILLGAGLEATGDLSIQRVAEAIRFEGVRWEQIGAQQRFDGYRTGWQDEILAAATARELDGQEEKNVHRNY